MVETAGTADDASQRGPEAAQTESGDHKQSEKGDETHLDAARKSPTPTGWPCSPSSEKELARIRATAPSPTFSSICATSCQIRVTLAV
eukprot:COSAG04_NODE_1865_length_5359_cov_3.964449_7_plen_88_part_00